MAEEERKKPEDEKYDVLVVGGGPAGLAAAFWLARYRYRVRLFDAGDPRNAPTWAVHGYLGMKDPPPMEMRRLGREQAVEAGAEMEAATVKTVGGEKEDFRVELADGRVFRSRRLLFATGLKDIVPELPGFDDFYGTSIWHCPDCDGPSVTGMRVGVIGWGKSTAKYCLYLLTWVGELTLLTHSHPDGMQADSMEALERNGIRIRHEAIVGLEGEGGQLRRVLFHDGTSLDLEAMFFHIATGPGSTLPQDMGCEADDEGIIQVDGDFETSVPGVYAAGDLTPGSRLVIRAGYEGTRAAIGIHKSLIPEDRRI